METINTNKIRIGNFTSSEIWKLCKEDKKGGFGAPALTYITEKNVERAFDLPLKTDVWSKEIAWGNWVEQFAFAKLGLEYTLSSQTTKQHELYDFWAGSADGFKGADTVFDIKCPFTRKSFFELIQIDSVEKFKEVKEEYYWQLVSNAILNDCKFAEFIVYMPYFTDLIDISQAVKEFDGDQKPFEFIFYNVDQCPFIKDGSIKLKDLNIFRFEVPEADKVYLTKRVTEASKLLNQY